MFIENFIKHKISTLERVRKTLFLKFEPYDLAITNFIDDIFQPLLDQPSE